MRLVTGPRSHPRLRLNVLRIIVFAALAVLIFRLWSLQVLQHGRYQVTAEGNRVRQVVTEAPRGIIVDDQGRPFATNRTELVITIDRSVLDRLSDSGRGVIGRLATVLHTTSAALQEQTRICTRTVGKPCWNGSPYQPIPVASNVSAQVALSIIEHPELFPGVAADTQAVRVYRTRSATPGPPARRSSPTRKPATPPTTSWARPASRAATTRSCAASPG
jgi:penicillin-binding protein 2